MLVYNGTPTTGSATLYTAALRCRSWAVVVANTTASAATATLKLNGTVILPAVSVPANTVISLKYPLALIVGDVIAGLQGTGSACNFFLDVTPE